MKKFKMTLKSCPNPDFGETRAKAAAITVEANTLRELRDVADAYIRKNDLGGGNWVSPVVRDIKSGQVVGHFSYNLRLWEGRGYSQGQRELVVD
jgi:hypothetical protein